MCFVELLRLGCYSVATVLMAGFHFGFPCKSSDVPQHLLFQHNSTCKCYNVLYSGQLRCVKVSWLLGGLTVGVGRASSSCFFQRLALLHIRGSWEAREEASRCEGGF
eukprot:Lithocolla_globosa_v1_NODE_483_length_3931_cov_110.479360.p5 type:complete len:107 gc:universal NODE_483_length_3931_cov_110.479360:1846-1526(-)